MNFIKITPNDFKSKKIIVIDHAFHRWHKRVGEQEQISSILECGIKEIENKIRKKHVKHLVDNYYELDNHIVFVAHFDVNNHIVIKTIIGSKYNNCALNNFKAYYYKRKKYGKLRL